MKIPFASHKIGFKIRLGLFGVEAMYYREPLAASTFVLTFFLISVKWGPSEVKEPLFTPEGFGIAFTGSMVAASWRHKHKIWDMPWYYRIAGVKYILSDGSTVFIPSTMRMPTGQEIKHPMFKGWFSYTRKDGHTDTVHAKFWESIHIMRPSFLLKYNTILEHHKRVLTVEFCQPVGEASHHSHKFPYPWHSHFDIKPGEKISEAFDRMQKEIVFE
jgi:hypothetical protein